MPDSDIGLYIWDIVISIKNILKYTKGMDFRQFRRDQRTVDAVVRNFEIIGEAASKIPPDFRRMHADVPWRDIVSMRNKVIHDYFGVDLSILWKTIEDDLPGLQKRFRKIYANLK